MSQLQVAQMQVLGLGCCKRVIVNCISWDNFVWSFFGGMQGGKWCLYVFVGFESIRASTTKGRLRVVETMERNMVWISHFDPFWSFLIHFDPIHFEGFSLMVFFLPLVECSVNSCSKDFLFLALCAWLGPAATCEAWTRRKNVHGWRLLIGLGRSWVATLWGEIGCSNLRPLFRLHKTIHQLRQSSASTATLKVPWLKILTSPCTKKKDPLSKLGFTCYPIFLQIGMTCRSILGCESPDTCVASLFFGALLEVPQSCLCQSRQSPSDKARLFKDHVFL